MAPKRQASPSNPRRRTRGPGSPMVCSKCSEIDFNSLSSPLAAAQSRYEGTVALKPCDPADDYCMFCEFLASLGPFESSANGVVQLQISHPDDEPFPLLGNSNANILKVQCQNSFIGSKYFVLQSDLQTPIRMIEPDRIDYDIIQEWLQICRELHPERCKATSVTVPNLHLIDCETKLIVPASGHEYVTLSYLWGANEDDTPFTSQLPLELPGTIEDALVVTLKLGFRYLWIDRYCINQQNKSETSAQVQAMASIYRNSQLTIIAAAGNDPSYGLPGVGKQHRHHQSHFKIDRAYLRGIQRIEQIVQPSRWNSRGWTYQEGILATRRLIFTTSQVYYECHGMTCCETFSLPYKSMHSLSNQRLSAKYFAIRPGRVGERIGMFPTPVAYSRGGKAGDVYVHIARYSLRSFSWDTDRLRAFLGILSAFETGGYGVLHHWGIPILPCPCPGGGSGIYTESGPASELERKFSMTSFVLGLMWTHKFRDKNIRIEGLPSWSWSGVLGGVEWAFGMGEGVFLDNATLFDVDVQMERRDGGLLAWEEFCGEYERLNVDGMLSPYIYLSAWSAPASTEPRRSSSKARGKHFDDQYCVLCVEMNDGLVIKREVFVPESESECGRRSGDTSTQRTVKDGDSEEEYEVVVLGQLSEFGGVFMLLVRNLGDDMWERVQRIFPTYEGEEDEEEEEEEEEGGEGWSFELETGDEGGEREMGTSETGRWGDKWWRCMKGGRTKTFRLG
ncbi:hypothetical protein IFR05_008033 [Cadophora sp. M221]|nr:hypothetical protein IFR05_008033 [Cadophora sp. M221]